MMPLVSQLSQSALILPEVKAIVAFTETGGTPKRLCKFRPSVPIIAVANNDKNMYKINVLLGRYLCIP